MNSSANLIIRNGHVCDPLNHRDGVMDVLVENGRIAEVGEALQAPRGALEIDAAGAWVLPGVIDSHCHIGSTFGSDWGARMALKSGVTMGIDMAGPLPDILERGHRTGSGFQLAVMDALPYDTDPERYLEQRLDEGAFGLKILGGHYPQPVEVCEKAIAAADRLHVAIAWHAGSTTAGSDIKGMQEAVKAARGLPLHMAHINAYCRGRVMPAAEEAEIALSLLKAHPEIYSEAYLCPGNATMLDTDEAGNLLDSVTKMCVKAFNVPVNREGLLSTIRDGHCVVCVPTDEGTVRVSPEEGVRAFEAAGHGGQGLMGSFPVNDPEIQKLLTTARRADGRFVVDAISTDGGAIPRNDLVERGLALVNAGALTLGEFVLKSSVIPARRLGLFDRGHFSTDAAADITIVDKTSRLARDVVIAGRPAMLAGRVMGEGLTFVTTQRGRANIERLGYKAIVSHVEAADRARDVSI